MLLHSDTVVIDQLKAKSEVEQENRTEYHNTQHLIPRRSTVLLLNQKPSREQYEDRGKSIQDRSKAERLSKEQKKEHLVLTDD